VACLDAHRGSSAASGRWPWRSRDASRAGGYFGVEGLPRALERAESPTAAGTALAIQDAVTDCWKQPLKDDATVVVMAIA
jgi:hypothetical protein